MPKRLVNHTITLYRNGLQVIPELGKPFDFTPEELASVNKSSPSAISLIGVSEDNVEKVGLDAADVGRVSAVIDPVTELQKSVAEPLPVAAKSKAG